MRKSLSVAIATFNEEKNIASCLESAKGLSDEVIIVDGSSSDKTVEIVRDLGAIVKITTNKPIFHINKQMAIDMASCDWILQLDADERLSQDLKKEINKILQLRNTKDGYWVPRKNWFLGRFLLKGGQYPDYTMRLYKKGKGRLPQKDVHEQAEIDGTVGFLKNPLLHYPYENFSSYLTKWNRYNDIFSIQIKQKLINQNVFVKVLYGINYLFIQPIIWFFLTYIRHKGFLDGYQGFIFSFFSALRFPVSFIKYLYV